MNFMKYKNIYFAISLLFLIPGIISLFLFGLKPAIDFTGGSLLEVKFTEQQQQLSQNQIQEYLDKSYELSSFISSGDHLPAGKAGQYVLKGKAIDQEQKEIVLGLLETGYGQVEELRFEAVGPTLGRELLNKTLVAVILVSGIITFYVWRQFSELKFGVCAILAMFHDSLILLGVFSILGHFFQVEVDVLFVTALLTTLSFSVHDTIVVYDRIRELKKNNPRKSLVSLVNTAVTETLARSINNSVTIIIMLLALALLGGETIRWFSVALLIGAVTGTYSSTFTAAPLLLLWEDISAKLKSRKK